jgi:phenylpropionate dioxygenase-like ring-hydroxylating dioxygenase large terminal subunit
MKRSASRWRGRRSRSSTRRGGFYVIDDTRTHRGGQLSEGEVSGEKVT